MEITVNIVDTLFDSIPKGTVVANYVTEVDTVNFKMYSTVYSIDETNKAIVTTKKVDANNLEAIHFDAINWVTTDKATIDNIYPKVVSKYQNKFKKEGVIYKITKDYDLNNCVLTISDNCTLQFEGGSIKNGTLTGTMSLIDNKNNATIFNNISITGTYNCTEVCSDWFKKSMTDDTENLQSLMALIPNGGKCIITEGDYNVSQPQAGDGLCINIPSNTHLIINGNIKMITNNYIRYNILSAINKHHIIIEGSGSIIGDSDTHQFIQGSTSEWGYGIRIKNSNNIEVRGLQIYNCIGDGICCGHISNVYIKDCTIYNCGRQGITLATTSSSIVKNCNIYGIRRTAPSACIDIEPDPQQGNSDNIVIKNCLFNDSAFGVSIFTPVGSTGKNIKIIGCTCTLTKDTDIAFTTNNSCDVIYENNIIEYTAASNNTASAFKLESSSDITIKDCFISFGFIYPIRTNKVDKLLISNLNSKALNACQLYYVNNLIVENSVFSNRTGRILDIESFNTVTVKNNIILLDGEGNYTPANNPILIKKYKTSDNPNKGLIIINNDISHKGYKTNSTNRAINIDDTDDVIIDNNNLYKETITTTAFSIYCNNVNFASITSNNIGSGTGVALLNSKRITGNYNVSIQGTNVQTFYYIDSTCSNCNLYLYHDSFKRLLQVNEFGISNEDGTEYSKVRFVTSNISLNFANTIYKIVSDIDLQGEELTIPANCTLDFQGGSFSNGTIIFSNTKIIASAYKLFENVIFMGALKDVIAIPEWFGAISNISVDSTNSLRYMFENIGVFSNINIDRDFMKSENINIGNVVNVTISGSGYIYNKNCNGFSGTFQKSNIKLKAKLTNTPYKAGTKAFEFKGSFNNFDLTAETSDNSQYDIAIDLYELDGNNIKCFANGNRMGLNEDAELSTIQNTLKGTGLRIGYGINNVVEDCYIIYFDKAFEIPFTTHPTLLFANEGTMVNNSRFLWCNNCIKLDVGTGLEFTNCMCDIAHKEAIIVNNVNRSILNGFWTGVKKGYTPWNIVITASKGILLNNFILPKANANVLQVSSSDNIIITNSICKYDSTSSGSNNLRITSTCTNTLLNNVRGVTIINESTSTIKNSYSKKLFNVTYTDSELGELEKPSKTLINSMGTRIRSIGGEKANVLEIWADSETDTAYNVGIGGTSKGVIVEYGSTTGIKTGRIVVEDPDLLKQGTTSERPTLTAEIRGYQYYDSTLKKPIWWDGTNWKDATGTTV